MWEITTTTLIKSLWNGFLKSICKISFTQIPAFAHIFASKTFQYFSWHLKQYKEEKKSFFLTLYSNIPLILNFPGGRQVSV